MKVAPLSADLVVKIAIGAAVLGAAYYLVKAATGQIKDAADAAAEWARNAAQGAADVASSAAHTASTDPNSLSAFLLYGGPLNPIARTAASVNAVVQAGNKPQTDGTFDSLGNYYSQPGALY